MRRTAWRGALVLALFLATSVAAAQSLVDARWLASHLDSAEVVVVEVARSETEFIKAHIPGSVFTDYAKDGWRVDRNGVVGLLNDVAALEDLLGRLGIDNSSHVVLVPLGQSSNDVAAAARLYWTLKVLGHARVSILDGGFAAYAAERGNPLMAGRQSRDRRRYRASPDMGMVAREAEVEAAMRDGIGLIDTRPSDQFLGINRSRSVKGRGTLPGARNLPLTWLTEDDGGRLRAAADLSRLAGFAGVTLSGRQIVFCNTAHTASLGWFVLHEVLGNQDVLLYDGSLAAWTADGKHPLEVALPAWSDR